jgi:hypothetical protein
MVLVPFLFHVVFFPELFRGLARVGFGFVSTGIDVPGVAISRAVLERFSISSVEGRRRALRDPAALFLTSTAAAPFLSMGSGAVIRIRR